MRIRPFFIAGISAAAVTGIIAAGLNLSAAWQHHAATTLAARAIKDFDQIAHIMDLIAAERGPTNVGLATDAPATDAQKAAVAATRVKVDESISAARDALRGADLPDAAAREAGLGRLTKSLQSVRAEVDRAIAVPKQNRDPAFMAANASRFYEIYDDVDALLDSLQTVALASASDITPTMLIARMGWAMRDWGGRRSSLILELMGTKKPMSVEAREILAGYKGQTERIWVQIGVLASMAGSPPRVQSAIDAVKAGYFGNSYAAYDAAMAAGTTGGNYGDLNAFRDRHISGLNLTLGIRDAAIAESLSRVADQRNAALVSLFVALGMMLVVIAAIVGVAFLFDRRIVNPILQITRTIARLADRDHGVVVPERGRADEIGEMADAIEILRKNAGAAEAIAAENAKHQEDRARRAQRIEGLAGGFDRDSSSLITEVSQSATEMRGQAEQSVGAARDASGRASAVSETARQAAANVQTAATSAERLSASIREITERVARSAEVATRAEATAGGTSQRVASLSDASRQIGDVVKLIQEVAAKTNLLALNATIEAARAGEAGKGFAVVAGEVKALASQTAKATDDITQQVTRIQTETAEAVTGIHAIAETIADISRLSAEIADAVGQQNGAAAEIARTIGQLAAGTETVTNDMVSVSTVIDQSKLRSEQMTSTVNALSGRAEQLTARIGRFLEEIQAA